MEAKIPKAQISIPGLTKSNSIHLLVEQASETQAGVWNVLYGCPPNFQSWVQLFVEARQSSFCMRYLEVTQYCSCYIPSNHLTRMLPSTQHFASQPPNCVLHGNFCQVKASSRVSHCDDILLPSPPPVCFTAASAK